MTDLSWTRARADRVFCHSARSRNLTKSERLFWKSSGFSAKERILSNTLALTFSLYSVTQKKTKSALDRDGAMVNDARFVKPSRISFSAARSSVDNDGS